MPSKEPSTITTLFLPPPEKVDIVARTLRGLANEQRLQILCLLSENNEMSVGELMQYLDLSQSALSQHLAKLKADNFVSSRKDGLSVFYKVERQDILEILHLLHGLYCA
jgi:DNA-binding transcriptional ArsR family regulator